VTALATAVVAEHSAQLAPAEAARIEERQRIGDDLHDEVAQILYAARLRLDFVLKCYPLDDDCLDAITRSRELIARADDAIRIVVGGLARPAEAPLDIRLRAAAARIERDLRLPIRAQLDDAAVERARDLPPALCDVLVKVAREALTNVGKHAWPCHAELRLELSDEHWIALTIADDGRPTAAPRPGRRRGRTAGRPYGGHGLPSLRRVMLRHGGMFAVQHDVRGTTVTAAIPLPATGGNGAAPS
jgi:signal transduction histidine kinase